MYVAKEQLKLVCIISLVQTRIYIPQLRVVAVQYAQVTNVFARSEIVEVQAAFRGCVAENGRHETCTLARECIAGVSVRIHGLKNKNNITVKIIKEMK